MNNALRDKAEQLLRPKTIVTLASISSDGYPRPTPMAIVSTSSKLSEIWMATSMETEKIKHFKDNPKAGISLYDDIHALDIVGRVEIVTSQHEKDFYWNDAFIDYFKEGKTDPLYCLLKFIPFKLKLISKNLKDEYCFETETMKFEPRKV